MLAVAKALARTAGIERKHVAAARMLIERHALATTPRPHQRRGGRILCYHSVDEPEMGVNDVRAAQLRQHIELMIERGHRFVPASDIALSGGSPNDIAITFDDGCNSVFTHAAKIFAEYSIPWSLFVVTNWSSHTEEWSRSRFVSWAEIERLVEAGVEIGSHTRTHPDFGKIGRAQMLDELAGSRLDFQKRLGFSPTSFAIPLGQSMNWTPEAGAIAREAGYQLIYAQAENTRPHDTIPRTFVTRFDNRRIFSALLDGAYDSWEEWV
jgi:peptidoglycan/xylan/chitin deacetylase (PgdA/CDA1 family)